ncbi:hypothetical protein GCM10011380_32480 [Sphingomonas metalli]|uniref:Uncharacterized protein n=1 Tax=Sphingomonas metalli TaxID=1779358 RepID=A0A916WYR8_9SPHN|nr:hypothetical protein [Sphingomonas metalli]GGB40505.1 hypothetical protein GCM10011380_32480 [Sphingomonas metalli]
MRPDLRHLLDGVAAVLEAARDDLERLAGTLCADADIALRHMAALQTLDRVGQCQAEVASMLRAEDPTAAADAIGVEGLRARLIARGRC